MAKLNMGVNLRTGLLLLTLTLAKCQDYTILEDDDFGYWDRIEDTDVQAQQLLESLCNNYDMKVNNQGIDCSSIQLTPKRTFWDANDELIVNHKLEKREVEEELTEGSGNGIISLAPLGDLPKEGDDASPTMYNAPVATAEAKEPAEEVAVQENVDDASVVKDEKPQPEPPVQSEADKLEVELQSATGDEPIPIPPADSVSNDSAQPGGDEAAPQPEDPAVRDDQTEDKLLDSELPTDAVRAPGSNNDDNPVEIPSEEDDVAPEGAEGGVEEPEPSGADIAGKTPSENDSALKHEDEKPTLEDPVLSFENSEGNIEPAESDIDVEQNAVKDPEPDVPVKTPSKDDSVAKLEDENAAADDAVPSTDNTETNIKPVEGNTPLGNGADIPLETPSDDNSAVNKETTSQNIAGPTAEPKPFATEQDEEKESKPDNDKNPVEPLSEDTSAVKQESQTPIAGDKSDDAQPSVDKGPTESEDPQKPISAFGVASLDTQKNKEADTSRSETTLAPRVDESNKDTSTQVDNSKEPEKVDEKQSGNSVLTKEPKSSDLSTVEGSDTEKQISGLSTNSEINDSREQPKTAESAKDVSTRGKDATVLIVLFVVVLVIGAAAFTHHFIKKRRANNESSSVNGITKDLESPKNGDVERGVEMKPLLDSNNKPLPSDKEDDEKA